MTLLPRPPSALLVLFAVAGAAVAVGCGPDAPSGSGPAKETVRDLELPTPAEEEAATKLREAEVFLAAGKPRLAEPPLRRVLELAPRSARAAEMLAHCLIGRGRVDEAEPLLRRALEVSPKNTDLRALHVRTLLRIGDPARAEAASLDWTKADTQNADAWFELGRAQYQLGKFEDAIPSFRRAETLKSSRADIRSELGLALAAAGQLGRAEATQRDAIDRQPDYAEAWFRLGDVIFRRDRGRAREAVDAMSKAVEHEPGNVVAHLYLFRTCRLADVPDDDPLRARGEEAWQAVLKLHGRAQVAAAIGVRNGDDRSSSEFALREQVSLYPDDPAPRLALARHLHVERRFDEAIDAYRRAIEIGAEGPAVHVQLAAALVSRGDPQAADAALVAASAIAPGDATVLRLRAWVLLLLGRDADALATAEAAVAAAPDGSPESVLAKKLRALARVHRGEVDAGLKEIAALGWL